MRALRAGYVAALDDVLTALRLKLKYTDSWGDGYIALKTFEDELAGARVKRLSGKAHPWKTK